MGRSHLPNRAIQSSHKQEQPALEVRHCTALISESAHSKIQPNQARQTDNFALEQNRNINSAHSMVALHNSKFIRSLITKGSVQEIVAKAGHGETAAGFALASATRIHSTMALPSSIVWVRQDAAVIEAGDLYAPGLSAFQVDTKKLIVMRARTFTDTLRAGLEAVRCAALDAVLIETMTPVDLTASRRFKLAAEKSGVATLLIRHADTAASNAISLRWRISAVPRTQQLKHWPEAPPARLNVELIKHPTGLAGVHWHVEWNHDKRQFEAYETLPQLMDSIPVSRPLVA